MKKKNWQGKTDGGRFGQQSLFFLLKYGNINVGYAIVAVVSFFYFIFNYRATKNIYLYFRKRIGYNIIYSLISTYRNNFLFAKTLIDKFAIFAGKNKKYTVEEIGSDLFEETVNNPNKGAIILNSHVGCAEIAGYVLSQHHKQMHALVYGGESAFIQKYRRNNMEKQNVYIIPVIDSFSHIFAIKETLKNADLLSMHADRVYNGSKKLICNFLGAPAEFSTGPFQLAIKFQVPILALFVMQNGHKKYKSYAIKIESNNLTEHSPKQQIDILTHQYVSALEDIVKQYPVQWYNFHKFWI